jgi:hypothetical protein
MMKCIGQCLGCNAICTERIDYCLRAGDAHAEATHIRTMMECAEICMTSANFMLRGSELHHYTCATCVTVCEACAMSCEPLDEDMMKHRCADVCRRCAEECRKMNRGVAPRRAA